MATMDDVELRMCTHDLISDETVLVEQLELYVQCPVIITHLA